MESQNIEQKKEDDALKGTLFSTLVFIDGGILLFIGLLFYFYLSRI